MAFICTRKPSKVLDAIQVGKLSVKIAGFGAGETRLCEGKWVLIVLWPEERRSLLNA